MRFRFATSTLDCAEARLVLVFALVANISVARAGTNRAYHPYAIQHWGSDQGLPVGPGSAVLQSRDGHIWFGTEEGLGRFNGTDCKIFDSFNTPAMKGNSITVLFEDRAGDLWIGNGTKGLVRLHNGAFERFGPESGLVNDTVSAIAEDRAGALWIGTDGGGLFRFEGGRFTPVVFAESAPDLFVTALATTPDGAVWAAYKENLRWIRGKETGLFKQSELKTGRLYSLQVDQRGQLWIGGTGVLAREAHGQIVREHTDAKLGQVSSIQTGPDGTLWLGTSYGVLRINGDDVERFDTSNGLSSDLVPFLMLDREGSVWVCGNANGVDQLKPSRFEVIGKAQGLSHSTVTSVLEDSKGDMWLATEDGLNRLADGKWTIFKREQGLSWNMVFTLAEGRDGAIWAGTWNGLNRYLGGNFTQFSVKDGLPARTIWCAMRDGDGTLWFGTPKGLVEYRDGRFQTLNHDDSGLSHDDVRCILRDGKGRLWVGTSYGLNRLKGFRFENFYEAAKDQPFNVVLTLHEDPEGGVWIGTQGNGLFLFRDGRFTRFTTAEGLFDNVVMKILEDGAGNLWLTSNRGLFRVSRKQLEAVAGGRVKRVTGRVFTKADGLPTTEFNGTVQPVGCKTRDGRLWFASTKGAVVVAPGRMFKNEVPPEVGLESVELDGDSKDVQSGSVIVPPGTDHVEFSYAVLSYVSPAALQSRYRLEGFDGGWFTNSARHDAQYTRLKPGTYRFRVAAANGDGVWNNDGVSLAVIVQPFVWQTGWFQAGAGAAALLFIVGLVYFVAGRNHRIALDALERRHALERERMRIASDLHDDVGSNLGSISLLSRDVERRLEGETAEDVSEITRLAQETSDAMRDIVWFVNPDEDTVEKMSLRMKDTAASLLGGAHFEIETPEPPVCSRLSPQFKRQFFLIFKESLHNISKHAGGADVVIRLRIERRNLVLEIKDNGAGFDVRESGGGHGLGSMRRRAVEQGWHLEITSDSGAGTRIRLVARLE